MEENKKKNKTKQIVILSICAITIVLASTLGTYAYFLTSLGREEKQELTYTTGTLALVFEDNSDGINEALTLGESITKEFKIRNTGTLPVTTNMLWSDMTNTYMDGSLTYKLEYKTSESGDLTDVVSAGTNVPRSSSSDDYLLAKDLTVPAGETHYYKLTITFNDIDKNQNEDINAIFASKFKLGEAPLSGPETTLKALKVKSQNCNINFANRATTDETSEGLCSMEDDYGTSYYYRGAVDNNYLKFGQNTSGEDMWWRIIRINGDGSLRIQYDGAGAAGGTTYIRRFTHTDKAYNAQYNDAKYVGWMFGGAQGVTSTSKEQAQRNETNSDIKTLVDTWYKETIADKGLGDKVADVIFCNDRSTPGKEASGWTDDTGLGYGQKLTAYGATSRTNVWNTEASKVQPQFTCPNKNDAFTVDDITKGNGDLTYPVGLITADEIVAAGSGKYNTSNSRCYLAKELWYWTLSPYNFGGSYANVFNENRNLNAAYVDNVGRAVAPVINLKPEYVKTMIGTGTISDPYRDNV